MEYDDTMEKEMDELYESLKGMNAKDRRRTLFQFRRSTDPETVENPDVRPKTPMVSTGSLDVSDGVNTRNHTTPTVITVDKGIRKIKNFSGSKHPSPGETDYKRWRRSALQIAYDPDLNANQKRNLVLQSVVGEAEDNIELVRDDTAIQIITFLDTIYGDTADGHDLMSRFYQTTQQANQTSSEYVTLLYRKLTEMVKSNMLQEEDLTKLLVKQFIRGTSDEHMVTRLCLDDSSDPMSFTELVSKMRKEETLRSSRNSRYKKDCRVRVVSAEADDNEVVSVSKESTVLDNIQERLTELESVSTVVRSQDSKPPPMFCYRCGIDGHFADLCQNPPNRELVRQKREKKRQYFLNQKN